jgi:hypothetical protein
MKESYKVSYQNIITSEATTIALIVGVMKEIPKNRRNRKISLSQMKINSVGLNLHESCQKKYTILEQYAENIIFMKTVKKKTRIVCRK